MAEGFSVAEANSIIDDIRTQYPFMQLHTGAPGVNGTSNVAANNTRKSVSFNAAANGATANSGAVLWASVPANEKYTHCTFWTLASGGSFGYSGTVTANTVNTGDDFQFNVGAISVSVIVAS